MKVYLDEGGEKSLVGRADIPDDTGPVFEVPLFSATSIIVEKYTLGVVTHLTADGGLLTERVVLLSPGQPGELLPGWTALSS